jgi:hypothetical protein
VSAHHLLTGMTRGGNQLLIRVLLSSWGKLARDKRLIFQG